MAKTYPGEIVKKNYRYHESGKKTTDGQVIYHRVPIKGDGRGRPARVVKGKRNFTPLPRGVEVLDVL